MNIIDHHFLKQLHLPAKNSHKGNNGRLMIIGGSRLFHGASLWALKVSSRIVDAVYYASVPQNQKIAQFLQKRLYAFICVPQGKEQDYIAESDVILIGPGMVRGSKEYTGTREDESQTREKVLGFLQAFPDKKWVIDAGALQVISPKDLAKLSQVIITPHQKEFERLFNVKLNLTNYNLDDGGFLQNIILVKQKALEFGLTIVLKGLVDIVASASGEIYLNKTGNEGMTKGGTGDVLAGLIASLYCTNDALVAAGVGIYINGLTGDLLYQKTGPFFNADDLVDKIPEALWKEMKRK
ncbi:NAD(P)H-hydrate dehydratase [Candidatus Beckwithbacteria bacterium]|nr:NAD(P)H-hydrate dehydratase [Candidatus Beckwithbacteria bacterium]